MIETRFSRLIPFIHAIYAFAIEVSFIQRINCEGENYPRISQDTIVTDL